MANEAQGQNLIKKFYILERMNPNTKVLGFYFNQIGIKEAARGFVNFLDALKAFIAIAKESKEQCILYFHRQGAYRGFVTLEQATAILFKLSKIKVDNTKIIAQLEANKMISPLTANKFASEQTMAVAIQEFDLDEKAKDVQLSLVSPNKPIDEIVMGDIKAELPGYTVEINRTLISGDELDVYYLIKKGQTKSSVFIKSIYGFGKTLKVSKARSIFEDIQLKAKQESKENTKFSAKAWTFFSVFTIVTILNLVLFILVVMKLVKLGKL